MNDRLTYQQLSNDQGHKVYHLQMKMPMMITNRSLITCFYEHEDAETGYRVFCHSSKGCEAIIEAERSEIGKNKIATFIVNHTQSKPYEGGMEIQMVLAMDIAGNIPSFVKNKIAKRLSNVGM